MTDEDPQIETLRLAHRIVADWENTELCIEERIAQALTSSRTEGFREGVEAAADSMQYSVFIDAEQRKHLASFIRSLAGANRPVSATPAPSGDGVPTTPQTWQPIETAPKDGTEVLVFQPGGRVFVARWDGDRYAKRPRPFWGGPTSYFFGVSSIRANPPTHWMPLPTPPETE